MLAEPVPRPVQTPGCKGRSPLHKKTKIPLPAGKGVGGMGQKSKLQAGVVGDKEGKPLVGYYSGRDCRCRKRSDAGAPGAEPPAKLTYSLPFPPGRGSGGWGQKSKLKVG